MIVGLVIKMLISFLQIIIRVSSDGNKTLFDSSWVVKNFNSYIDLFLIGPVLILLIMPINAMGLEWFSIVLLLCGKRKNEELDGVRVERTFSRLKTGFIAQSVFMLFIWVSRIALHAWTAHLGALAKIKITNLDFYCEKTGNSDALDHSKEPPCVMLSINSAILMIYIIATILLYSYTFAFLLRLGCCPNFCEKTEAIETES
jgi:hypothetical protein